MLEKIRRLLIIAIVGVCLGPVAEARVDEVSYKKNGVYVGKIRTYELNSLLYLDAAGAAKIMGGKIYWYPVSGKLLLQNKGNKVVFLMRSNDVSLNDSKATFHQPLIVRGGKAFLALEFFTSKYFSKAFGFKLDYNSDTEALTAMQAVNVNSVNFFTYKDKTRLVVYLASPLEYASHRKENNVLVITIPGAIVYGEDKLNIEDGVVKSLELFQDNKLARVVVTPGDNFGEFSSFSLTEPDRIVLDITKKEKPIRQGLSGQQPPAPPPALPEEELPVPGEISVIAPEQSVRESSTSALSAALDQMKPVGVSIPDKFIVNDGARKRIVIDAGHGGKDAGGRKAFGLREKELNLLVALELYKLLKEEDLFEVMLTRTSDIFVPLTDRSKIANEYKADIFVSIHANASRDKREKGFEVYFMSEKASDPWAAEVADYENSVLGLEDGENSADPSAMLLHSLARNEYMNEGSRLAGLISKELEKNTPFVNRNVKQAAFYVLRGTYAPGVLVEMGFMTNPNDQKRLNEKKMSFKIANAIFKGIMKYAQLQKWK